MSRNSTACVKLQATQQFTVTVARTKHEIAWRDGAWWVDEVKTSAHCVRHSGGVSVFQDGSHHFGLLDPLSVADGPDAPGDVVEAPMPGQVKAVFVLPGDCVVKGDRLALLEAMKMEHTLIAARDGIVAEVPFAPGHQVEAGTILILMEGEN